MTESQEKFLRLVAARVPLDRVFEVHLFPPIRSGALETGIAVLAVDPEPAPSPAAPADAAPVPDEGAGAGIMAGAAGSDALACDPTDDAAGPVPRHADEEPAIVTADVAEGSARVPGGEDAEADATSDARATTDANEPADGERASRPASGAQETTRDAGGPPQDQISPVAPVGASSSERHSAPHAALADSAEAGAHVPAAGDEEAAAGPAPRPAPKRHTVYTARYRYTIKGPDRGKFDVDVQAEADAPLVTIDLVVRGVQHRANEPAEAERLTGDRQRALAAPSGGSPGRAA